MPGLLLWRRRGERVRLLTRGGEVIWFEVADLRGRRARVRINADRDVEITREELLPHRQRPAGAAGDTPGGSNHGEQQQQ